MIALFPEPASTAFAVAALAGLKRGEIEGLDWSDFRHSNVNVTLGHYIKPQTQDVIAAMGKFEAEMAAHTFGDSNGTAIRPRVQCPNL